MLNLTTEFTAHISRRLLSDYLRPVGRLEREKIRQLNLSTNEQNHAKAD
jgi:hypothetical protein